MATLTGQGTQDKKFKKFCEYMEYIKYYLENNTHRLGSDQRLKRAVVKATSSNQYRIDETGTLFYMAPNSGLWQRIITSDEEKQGILLNCHVAPSAGHSGINATTDKITQRYYWKGVKEEVKDYVSRCDACQRSQKIKTMAPKLVPTQVVESLYMVGMDLIGPLPETSDGYKYVLTLTDYFTKWVELYPLKQKSGACVAEKIESYIYRTNRTLKTRLGKLCNEKQNDWDCYLEAVAFSLRTQKKASTKFTPFYLMYNREPRLPIEMDVSHDEDIEINSISSLNVEEYQACLQSQVEMVHKKVLENVDGSEKAKGVWCKKENMRAE
ncbi:Gypsy retrotransposon integrase-like protein 1-like 5 [Homarus americanus]|uniref:Gypsy retrotransposon integrase-like protein 1-like 5 n=1 Tax=Homarus americanus TaxID=6706 RepID=A0A8J5N3I8_HOMAM|nr:Gypsy retrotransposon integrase-like protein 1-like 5 [Homarus americanus]